MNDRMNVTDSGISPGIFQRLFLRPLGLNSDNSLVLWLILLGAVVLSGSLWYFEGDIVVALCLMYVVTIFLLSILKPDVSFMVLLFLVLSLDQYGIPEFEHTWTWTIDFFRNLKEISYIPYLENGVFNPIEMHFLFLIIGLYLIRGVNREFTFKGIPVWGACAFFFVMFLFSFLYGLQKGGDFMVALWEVRALFYLLLVYLITPQLIRTRQQLNVMIWIFIAGITFKVLQVLYRFVSMGFSTGGLATLSNHEDPVFMVTLLILLLGFIIFKSNNKQALFLLAILFPMLLAYYLGLRRAAFASGMVSFVVFVVLIPSYIRKKYIKYGVTALIFLGLYTAAFWNNNGRLGRPIQMIKSGFERPSIEENYADYYSNLYREMEAYNLAYTVQNSPVIGTGFGNAYMQPLPLYAIRFPLMDYIPHNEIIWVLVKMGAVGFFSFWLFFNAFVAKGVKVFQSLKDPYLKAVTAFIIIAVINQMVVSYFDLQLTYYRNMIYLGCIMGLLKTVIDIRDEEEESDKKATAPEKKGVRK